MAYTDIKKYLRIRRSSFKEIFLAILITILLLPFGYFISYLIINSLDIPEVFKNLGSELFAAHSTGQFILII